MLAETDVPIGTMTFNNPARYNAVSSAMWERASEIIDAFAADESVRVMVVTGAGEKAFVSGADISEFEGQQSNAEAHAVQQAITNTARDKLINIGKPTIAKIRGYCLGGGVATALACDIRICSDDSRFAIPAGRLGVAYEYDDLRKLVEVVGPSFTKEIFFTARMFSAQEAKDMGLVDRVVPAAELDDYVRDYALMIAGNAPLTMKAAKFSILQALKNPADRDLDQCDALVDDCHASDDYTEGRTAFTEKRKPNFKGR